MNLNKVFILGRMTADPVTRSTPSGASVANFSVATNRVWTDKSGNRKEEPEFHNIVAWGKQADIINKFLKKGSLILVEGRIQTRSWDDKSGQKRKTTEIVAESIQMGPRPMGRNPEGSAPAATEKAEEVIPTIEIEEDIKPEDLPF